MLLSLRAQPHITRRTGVGLAPWLVALFAGSAALGAFFLLQPVAVGGRYYKVGYNRTTYEYSRAIVALFVPYALALWAWRRGHRAPLWVLLAGALVLHILVLFAPLPQSQDFYQYLFYGRIQAAHGGNPYILPPATFWADPWFPWIRWSNATSVYGPLWMLTTWGVAKAAGRSLATGFVLLKLVVLALDFGVMAMIVAGARRRPEPQEAAGWGILAYAWNPLVLVTVPLGGAADVALAAALLGAVLARRRGRTYLATGLLTAGGLVKLYGMIGVLLHLALVRRERGNRVALAHAGVAAAIAGAASAPYWKGLQTFSGLFNAAGLTNQSFTGLLQRLVVPVLRTAGFHTANHGAEILMHWIAGALLVGVVLWAVTRVREERQLWYLILVVLVAYLYLTPWSLYWYTVAPLALVAMLPRNRLTYPVLVFSGTQLLTLGGNRHLVPFLEQTLLRYAPPALVYAIGRRRSRAPAHAVDRPTEAPAVLPVPGPSAALQRTPAAK